MTLASRLISCTLAGLLLSLAPAAEDAGRKPESLADCERAVHERPDDFFSWVCFEKVARAGDRAGVTRNLESRLQLEPEDPWMLLALGVVASKPDPERAERLFAAAATAFADRGVAEGEAQAWFHLGRFCRRRHRLEEGDEHLSRSAELAQAAAADELAVLAMTEECATWVMQGRYAEAWIELKRLEQRGVATMDRRIASSFHSAIANCALNMNLDEEALHYFELAANESDSNLYKLLNSHEQINTLAKMAAAAGSLANGSKPRRGRRWRWRSDPEFP